MTERGVATSESSTVPEARVGTVLGRYRLDHIVGSGSTAVVYAATDTERHVRVALKVLREGRASPPEARTRLLVAARASEEAQHPGIVPVVEVNESASHAYVVMPLVDGRDMRWLLDREPVLDPRLVGWVGAGIAAALDDAHARKIVHGDVKPANVIIGRVGPSSPVRAFVTDFGGGITPGYSAPEARRGEPVDRRADVYSLGVLLYECLTGSLPCQPFVDHDGVLSVPSLLGTPPSLRARRPDLPIALDEVIARAMAPRSADRYSSCGALMEAALPGLDGSEQSTIPPPSPHAASAAQPRSVEHTVDVSPTGGRARLLAGIAVVVALFASLVIVSQGSATGTGTASPSRVSAVEQLLRRVPGSIRSRCGATAGHFPGATAEVACSGGGGVVATIYGSYRDRASLRDAFRGRRGRASVTASGSGSASSGRGSACAEGRPEERAWRATPTDAAPAGEYRCSLAQGRAFITWTTDRALILAEAERGDTDLAALYSWWQREPGPLTRTRGR